VIKCREWDTDLVGGGPGNELVRDTAVMASAQGLGRVRVRARMIYPNTDVVRLSLVAVVREPTYSLVAVYRVE
jgi:hypothetical protein